MHKSKKYYLSRRIQVLIYSYGVYIVQVLLVTFFMTTKGKLLILFIELTLVVILLLVTYYLVYLPYKKYKKLLQLFELGYIFEELFVQPMALSPEIDRMMDKFGELLNKDKLLSASKKQAQYLALQNQINPHFLYNTLEAIRSEAISEGLTGVEKMTEALSTFFRYTISNIENMVTLNDELDNIRTYYVIQKYRFGDKVSLDIRIDSEDEETVLSYKIPKLILQPIVENAIYHGIERKVQNGHINIKITLTYKRLIIKISDDGVGIAEEKLRFMNEVLSKAPIDLIKLTDEKRGGIAIVNVNTRIKLLFGEEYGIVFYSALGIGTDVVVTLPR